MDPIFGKDRLEVGDLVIFVSTFHPFQRDYDNRNPGIVLHIKGSPYKEAIGGERMSVTVMWSNGEVTKEHHTYLQNG